MVKPAGLPVRLNWGTPISSAADHSAQPTEGGFDHVAPKRSVPVPILTPVPIHGELLERCMPSANNCGGLVKLPVPTIAGVVQQWEKEPPMS